jgi:hypothetical protein
MAVVVNVELFELFNESEEALMRILANAAAASSSAQLTDEVTADHVEMINDRKEIEDKYEIIQIFKCYASMFQKVILTHLQLLVTLPTWLSSQDQTLMHRQDANL